MKRIIYLDGNVKELNINEVMLDNAISIEGKHYQLKKIVQTYKREEGFLKHEYFEEIKIHNYKGQTIRIPNIKE